MGAARIFFRRAPLRFEQTRRVKQDAAQPTTVSRVNSLNSDPTMPDAPTALSVMVFADQPRWFVPPRRIDLTDPFGNLVSGQPARRGPCRLVDYSASAFGDGLLPIFLVVTDADATEAVKYPGRGRQRVRSFLYLADPAGRAFLGRPAAKG